MVVYEKNTPHFAIQVMKGTEKYPGRLPALMSSAVRPRDHLRYFDHVRKKYIMMYDRSLIDIKADVDTMATRYNRYIKIFEPFLTDYDREEVLPTTVALGIMKPAATDLDAVGTLGMDTDVTYDADVIDAVFDDYIKNNPNPKVDLALSLARARFLGYPYMIGGMNRELNDVLLAVMAAMVAGVHSRHGRKDSLAYLYDLLRPFHGDPFAMEGSRRQTSAKELPIIVREGVYSSHNLEPRWRIINMESKLSTMDQRIPIKRMLDYILKHPVHTQDRVKIKDFMAKYESKGWLLTSADQSKFDFRHGGNRGRQQIELHGKILNDPDYVKSAILSFNGRFVASGHKDIWQVPGDSLLKSGLGFTTLVGCTGNYTSIIATLSKMWHLQPKKVTSLRGVKWDALCWGDDSVIAFEDHSDWELYQKVVKTFKLEVTPEPTLKYLGSNYGSFDFKGSYDKGYSVGRFFQQQFFPEREKVYPFSLIGYIARLDLIGDKAKDIHGLMKPFMEELELGKSFEFSERHNILESLIPEMQKRGDKIGLIDDALQIFTHGLSDLDDVSSDFPGVYYDLLGLSTSADLADPVRFLNLVREEDKKLTHKTRISDQMIRSVVNLSKGDFSTYPLTLSEIVSTFKMTYNPGSVIY